MTPVGCLQIINTTSTCSLRRPFSSSLASWLEKSQETLWWNGSKGSKSAKQTFNLPHRKKTARCLLHGHLLKKNQTQTPRKIFVNERSILGHPCRELLMVQRLTWKRVRSAASTKKMMPSTWVVHAVPLYESRKWILKSIFCGTSDCTGHP